VPASSLPAAVLKDLATIFLIVSVPIDRDKRNVIRLLAVVVMARHRTSSSQERNALYVDKRPVMTWLECRGHLCGLQ
jgi:hypothetical protein